MENKLESKGGDTGKWQEWINAMANDISKGKSVNLALSYKHHLKRILDSLRTAGCAAEAEIIYSSAPPGSSSKTPLGYSIKKKRY